MPYQPQINGLRALVEVGGVKMVEQKHVDMCGCLADALRQAYQPMHAGREWTHADMAKHLGMSQGNLTKKLNGGNLPQGFLMRFCRMVGNTLPIQYEAAKIGYTLTPMPQQASIKELREELARLEMKQAVNQYN